MAGNPLRWAVHLSVVLFVLLWTLPTFGLLVTSFRGRDQIATSGWWTALGASTHNAMFRAPEGEGEAQDGARFVLKGSVFEGGAGTIAGDRRASDGSAGICHARGSVNFARDAASLHHATLRGYPSSGR